jgi:hypothetical protein
MDAMDDLDVATGSAAGPVDVCRDAGVARSGTDWFDWPGGHERGTCLHWPDSRSLACFVKTVESGSRHVNEAHVEIAVAAVIARPSSRHSAVAGDEVGRAGDEGHEEPVSAQDGFAADPVGLPLTATDRGALGRRGDRGRDGQCCPEQGGDHRRWRAMDQVHLVGAVRPTRGEPDTRSRSAARDRASTTVAGSTGCQPPRVGAV